ncbi:hypothetical protein [Cohnella pontilimi]|uniref:hypothetical protein n=1 Tax=Cohnella pontilimi TaxID=2564100 RepID=UPI001FEA83EB|nr:hypothetical protein [Cohnella pontilimi]
MVKQANRKRYITAHILQSVSTAMVPFYTAIALKPQYAARWSKAVIKADLTKMQKMLRQVSPRAGNQLGSNGIGYFVTFSLSNSTINYTNGTTIPPGSVQFNFDTRVHRSIAHSVLPFYRRIAEFRPFASTLAKAIRKGDTKAVTCMTRSCIRTPALKSVSIEGSGFALLFEYSFSKYPYRNLLLNESD